MIFPNLSLFCRGRAPAPLGWYGRARALRPP